MFPAFSTSFASVPTIYSVMLAYYRIKLLKFISTFPVPAAEFIRAAWRGQGTTRKVRRTGELGSLGSTTHRMWRRLN
jgi:hypothetical protein